MGAGPGPGPLRTSRTSPRTPSRASSRTSAPLLLPASLLAVLVLALLVAHTTPARAKPMAMASPDQVLENMKQIPQWHCLRYRKFDLVTQHKRCRHFRIDRKH
ncbi:uncharacterized protein LOC117650051 [Thrips palmi]|uniref:Uncharacterized protein LOC117650051 n=1 Tax=Thrips palmi TaxID=161013 RepID=A0A6P8ZWK8_THRPL|nr:uncharacterized protein LOC117650051 [Thrips palmi]